MVREVFPPFPAVVDEVSARLVAGGAVLLSVLVLATRSPVLDAIMAAGFWLRVVSGPHRSPLALLVTRVIRPRLSLAERPTAGPPKRFAQAIGATLSTLGLLLALGGAAPSVWLLPFAAIALAASLEAFVGYCLGCAIFARLMRAGLIPEDTCEACNDLRLAQSPAVASR